MKTAKVVEVRDLGPLTPPETAGLVKDDVRMDRISALLRLYPSITKGEKDELLHFLKKGPQVEIGLIGTREGMAARMAEFRRDHRAAFRLTPKEIIGFTVLILVPLLALVWLCMR